METKAVLFVDNDEIMLRSLERGFLDEQFDEHFVKSGLEASEVVRREKMQVLITSTSWQSQRMLAVGDSTIQCQVEKSQVC